MRSLRKTGRRKTARRKSGQGIWGRRKKVSSPGPSRVKKGLLTKRGAARTRLERALVASAASLLLLFLVSQTFAPARPGALWSSGSLASIVVRGHRQVSADEIAGWTELAAGSSLTALDLAALEAKLATHPRLARATVMRLFPSKLLIGVQERVGVISVIAPNQEVYVVDANGVAFDRATPLEMSTLPRVTSDQPIALQDVNPTLVEGISLLAAAREQNLPNIAEIHFAAAEGLSFRFQESAAKVLVGHGAMQAKLAQMAKLAAVNLPETASATLIDLRFQDRAVLKTETLPSETQTAAGP